MEDDVVSLHGRRERGQVERVALDEVRATAREMLCDEGALSDAHVVEDGDGAALDESIDQMAPDEPSSPDDERAHALHLISAETGRAARFSGPSAEPPIAPWLRDLRSFRATKAYHASPPTLDSKRASPDHSHGGR